MAHVHDPTEPVWTNQTLPHGIARFKQNFELDLKSDFG
jgi:hypothetical protein